MERIEIARLRIGNSGLTGASFDTPEEVVRWHGAMQAQDYGPAKWSIGQRTAKVIDEGIDRALATGTIVRTHVLRPTWHFAARDDIRWLLALTGPRVHRHNERRYLELGLDQGTRAKCEAVISSALEGGNHLTRKQIAEILHNAGIDASSQRLAYILMHCELEAAICSGGIVGKQQTYALFDERVPNRQRLDRDEALVEFVRRYLRSHGPATVRDLGWWSSLMVADINKALHLLGSEVKSHKVDGLTFWSMLPDVSDVQNAGGIHLLPAYDELIVGFTESRFFADPRGAAVQSARRERSMPTGLVLMNGRVLGHWKRTIEKDRIRVEAVLYENPKPSTIRTLEAAAGKLGRFLGRDGSLEMTQL